MATGIDKIPKPDEESRAGPFRILSSARLLVLLLVISIAQYVNTGSVSWLTDTFRWIETSVTGLSNNPAESLNKAGSAIEDIAKRVGSAIPGTDSIAGTVGQGEQADISWSAPAYELSGKVVKIADGDTLTILDAQRVKHKIRLYGIDTPEYDQPYFGAAKRALSKLVANKAVGIDVKDTDTYGRTVGVVYVDGRSVNLAMVRGGHAWWYKRYAGLNETLREAQEHAQAYELGLWQDPNPVAPWDWRRQRR
jgi:endonuclease YncB( thermonuclease family)